MLGTKPPPPFSNLFVVEETANYSVLEGTTMHTIFIVNTNKTINV